MSQPALGGGEGRDLWAPVYGPIRVEVHCTAFVRCPLVRKALAPTPHSWVALKGEPLGSLTRGDGFPKRTKTRFSIAP